MKRPWNMVDVPVYSLATYQDGQVNMNICTYVSAVSMNPKLYMVALDYQTKTYDNLHQSKVAVLQILHEDHSSLVKLLGKKSGSKIDKAHKLQKQQLLTDWQGHQVLKGACGYLLLNLKDRSNIGGDHELFYFEVEKSTTKNDKGILMFQELIKKGIIL